MEHISIEQALYLYRTTDNSKGEVLGEVNGRPEDLVHLFPEEIYGFVKKEIERNRLVDTTLKMLDFTYEIKKWPTGGYENILTKYEPPHVLYYL